MGNISISRLLTIVSIAFIGTVFTVFGDSVRTSETKDVSELGPLLAIYGSKALAAGFSAAASSLLAFFTMPFSGTQANALKVGK